jgi:Na+/H+ antiporter NhaD/arsenite permease-like protein
VGLGIFLATYVVLAGVRLPGLKLSRPGGALVGAAAMVAFRVLTPPQAALAVDADTLVLLLGMMVLASALTQASFFRAAAFAVLKLTRTPLSLLAALVLVSGALSAVLVNDTVCLMLTPLVLALTEEAELPPVPYLLALCMAANAGSVATFTGNPQNMLIGVASGVAYGRFVGFMLLPALASLGCVYLVLWLTFRHALPARPIAPKGLRPVVNRRLMGVSLAVLGAVVVAFFAGLSMAWSALAGAAVVLVFSGTHERETLERVDFLLLLFFASLFIVVQGVNQEGWAERMRELFAPLMSGSPLRETLGFSALTVVASNLFSNVPFVMLARVWVPGMNEPTLAWEVLALASTLAGNLTLIGSVANLIVFEGARGKAHLSFTGYLKVGGPATALSLVAGVGLLLLEHRLVG